MEGCGESGGLYFRSHAGARREEGGDADTGGCIGDAAAPWIRVGDASDRGAVPLLSDEGQVWLRRGCWRKPARRRKRRVLVGWEEWVRNRLTQHKGTTPAERARWFDMHRRSLSNRYLRPLLEAGLLERRYPDRPYSPKQACRTRREEVPPHSGIQYR